MPIAITCFTFSFIRSTSRGTHLATAMVSSSHTDKSVQLSQANTYLASQMGVIYNSHEFPVDPFTIFGLFLHNTHISAPETDAEHPSSSMGMWGWRIGTPV
jgi:hypothetical protein